MSGFKLLLSESAIDYGFKGVTWVIIFSTLIGLKLAIDAYVVYMF